MNRNYHYFIDENYIDHGRNIYDDKIPEVGDIIEPLCERWEVLGLKFHHYFDALPGTYEIVGLEVKPFKD